MTCRVSSWQILSFVLCALWLPIEASSEETASIAPTAESVLEAPLTLASSLVGNMFVEGHSWYLSVNSDGQACLTIEKLPELPTCTYKINRNQLLTLRRTLIDNRFFDLRQQYGDYVVEGSEMALAITVGSLTHSVTLNHLPSRIASGTKSELGEIIRAIEIFQVVESWVSDPRAVKASKSLASLRKAARKRYEQL